MCIYEKFCCVICNTIVNEECKYILNHNSDKFMYSLSYTPQKLKKKHRNKVCPPDMYDRYSKLGSVIFGVFFDLVFDPRYFKEITEDKG